MEEYDIEISPAAPGSEISNQIVNVLICHWHTAHYIVFIEW
jgi:hypothetical protein